MKPLLSLLFLALSSPAFASEKAIEFGSRLDSEKPELYIYKDIETPIPRCMNCVYFNVILNDRDTRLGTPFISKVMIVAKHPAGESIDMPRVIELNHFLSVNRHPSSPIKSNDTVTISLPAGRDTKVDDIEFEFFALARRCMNPTVPECKDDIVKLSGKFTGKDLRSLEPTDAYELSKPDSGVNN